MTTVEHECDKGGALSHYLQKYINKYGNILTNIWENYSVSGKYLPLGVVETTSSRIDQLSYTLTLFLFLDFSISKVRFYSFCRILEILENQKIPLLSNSISSSLYIFSVSTQPRFSFRLRRASAPR